MTYSVEKLLSEPKKGCEGSGSAANVYALSTKRVVRISRDEENDGCLFFHKKLLKAPVQSKNPYFPRIYFHESNVTVMEKLNHFDWAKASEKLKLEFEILSNYTCEYGSDNVEKMIYEFVFKHLSPDFKKAFKFLEKMVDFDLGWDVHEGNVMVRGKNQLVFTDLIG